MPELLTYQWNPATAYAAVNATALMNQHRADQATSMALKLAELAKQHEEDAEKSKQFAAKLDFDRQQEARVAAMQGRGYDLEAGRLGETQRHNMAGELLNQQNSPSGFIPKAIPNDPATGTPPARTSMAETLAPDGQPALPTRALDLADVPLVPDSMPAPASKRGSQLAMQATSPFPFSADQVQEYNQAGFAGGQKAATQALQTAVRSNEQVDVARQKADMKAPPEGSDALFGTLDEATSKSDELKKKGFNAAPIFNSKTGKYAMKFWSKDEDVVVRRNSKLASDTITRSITEGDTAVTKLEKRRQALEKANPVITTTTGVFADKNGVFRFGQANTEAEESPRATPEKIAAYHEYQSIGPVIETHKTELERLRSKRKDFEDVATSGFQSDYFTRKTGGASDDIAKVQAAPPAEGAPVAAPAKEAPAAIVARVKAAGGSKEDARKALHDAGYTNF